MILSDIHGNPSYLKKALHIFDEIRRQSRQLQKKQEKQLEIRQSGNKQAEKSRNAPTYALLIAGDIAVGHSDEVAVLLNRYRNHITAVYGNSDSSRDRQVLQFPLTLLRRIPFTDTAGNTRTLFMHHGHETLDFLKEEMQYGDILVTGHTHRPSLDIDDGGIIRINPGSLSLPRGNYKHSFALLEYPKVQIVELPRRKVLKEITIPSLSLN
ncbi:MAG: YfcE family phosphodiesterase [Spirochaetia bacterium]|nr:YfcE family phosphodiesterase [Spirochaetia bacterium]